MSSFAVHQVLKSKHSAVVQGLRDIVGETNKPIISVSKHHFTHEL